MTENSRALPRLLQGAFLSCCNLLAGILIGLVLTPCLLSSLGERHYGIYLFAGLFTGWCGLIDFGLTTAVSRFITLRFTSRDDRRLQETGNTALILFSLLGLIVLLISGLTALAVQIFFRSVPDADLISLVVLIAGGGFGVSKLTDGVSGIINGTMRQELTASRNLIFRILFGLTALAVLYCGGKVIALVTMNFVLTVLQLIVLTLLVKKAYPEFRFSLKKFRRARVYELFGYSVYTFLTQVGDLMIQRSDLLLIAFFFSIEEMARYNLVVVVLVSYYGSFMNAMTGWMTNWFTHLLTAGKDQELEQWRQIFYKLSTYAVFFMSFGLIAWGRAFLTRWIGSDYLSIFSCLVLFAASMALVRGHSEVNLRYLQGIARHKYYAFVLIIQGIFGILFSFIFIKLGYGLWGVALGAVLPMLAVHELAVPWIVCRFTGESLPKYWLRIFRYQAAALLALVPVGAVSWLLTAPSWSALLLTGSLSAAVYWGPLLWFGFNKEEKKMLKSVFPRFEKKSDNPIR